MKSGGAVVARVPRQAVEAGSVLVGVHYSLISVGTELASLKAPLAPTPDGAGAVLKGAAYANLAVHYLKASLRDPQKAARRLTSIARRRLAQMRPEAKQTLSPAVGIGDLDWMKAAAQSFQSHDGRLEIVTDASNGDYQVMTRPLEGAEDQVPL